jgi:hypothetical protein
MKVAVIYAIVIVINIRVTDTMNPDLTNAKGYANGPVANTKLMMVADPAHALIGFRTLLSAIILSGAVSID